MSDAQPVRTVDELAQLGIKRGSMIWPIIAVLIAALTLAISFQSSKKSAINQLFEASCRGVTSLSLNGKSAQEAKLHPIARKCFDHVRPEQTEAVKEATASEAAKSIRAEFETKGRLSLYEKLSIVSALYSFDGNTLRAPSGEKQAGAKEVRPSSYFDAWNAWNLFAESVQLYARELFEKFGDIISDLAINAGVVALAAMIPGLAGMVYRRNFWGWFTPFFAVLFVATSGIFGQKSEEGKILIFLISQVLILLLALRLQRYTRKSSLLPTKIQNWALAAILVGIAIAWWFKVGEEYWSRFHWWYQWQFILIGLPVIYSLLRRSDVWSSTQAKNIVVCLDGTTNTPDQFENGRLAQTNVFKLFKMLKADPRKPDGVPTRSFNASLSKKYSDKQLGLYYSGVGNKFEYDPIVQALGGATGLGAAGVVDKAYLDIIRVYRPGDRIYIYGFSRGAAIARLLARAIHQRGAPQTIWTWRLLGRHWTLWQSRRAHVAKVPVTVLGCFDTVGAFGIGKNIAGINFQKLDLFKDLTVPDNVEQAYHIVALDETREEFSPTLMDPDPLNPTRLIEVWFSGDHANIGGGWGTTKLSDLTMDFLLRKVSSGYAHSGGMTPGDESWGMYLSAANGNNIRHEVSQAAGAYEIYPDALGQLRLWKSAIYIYKPRALPHHAVISETVFQRMTEATPLYAPQSLFNLHDELNKKRESINTAITRLKDTNSLSPEEHAAILTFKDRLHLIRWPQYEAELKKLAAPAPEAILENPPRQHNQGADKLARIQTAKEQPASAAS